MTTTPIELLLPLVVRTAIEAGEAIMEIYDSPQTEWEVERKADNSPLTLADRRSHEVIARALASTGIHLLSEEGSKTPYAERQAWSELWIVDPLDGTKEFIKRNGEFTVNIALVRQGAPVLGVIFVPVSRTLYVGSPAGAWRAVVAAGAYEINALAATPIHAARLKRPAVVASRSHLNADTEAFIQDLEAQHPEGIDVVSAGSSLKFCLVAEGKADFYPRFAPTMEWDTAAGHAICQAAGACVCQANGEPLRYNRENLLNPYFLVKAE